MRSPDKKDYSLSDAEYKFLSKMGSSEWRAGDLGFEVWGKKSDLCRPENAQATMFCRPAGKVLKGLMGKSLVRVREDNLSRLRLWRLTESGRRLADRNTK